MVRVAKNFWGQWLMTVSEGAKLEQVIQSVHSPLKMHFGIDIVAPLLRLELGFGNTLTNVVD